MAVTPEAVEKVARAICLDAAGRITGPGQNCASREFGWKADGGHLEQYVERHWKEYVNAAELAGAALSAQAPGEYERGLEDAARVLDTMIAAGRDQASGQLESAYRAIRALASAPPQARGKFDGLSDDELAVLRGWLPSSWRDTTIEGRLWREVAAELRARAAPPQEPPPEARAAVPASPEATP